MDRNNPALGVFFGCRREPPLEPPDWIECMHCGSDGTACQHCGCEGEPEPCCAWCGEPLGEDAVRLADGDTLHAACVFECEDGLPLAGWRDDDFADGDKDAE